MRHAYGVVDADARFPDYRGELRSAAEMMPAGCECAAVTLGRIEPSDCQQFSLGCNTDSPYGPCMASDEGACHVRATGGHLS